MKLKDSLLLSTRMFKTRALRTFLTILGVSVGIGTVLFLVSLGYGLQKVILSKITTADALLSLDVSAGTSDLIELDQASIDNISKIEEVESVTPMLSLSCQISTNEFNGDGLAYVTDSSYFRLGGIIPQYGNLFTEESNDEIVISSAGAMLFNFTPEEIIGKQVSLILFVPKINEEGFEEVEIFNREEKYTVVGVVDDENSNFIFVPRESLSDLSFEKYDQLKVKVANESYMEKVRDDIISMGFLVSSLSDTIEQAKKIFKIIQIILALFGFVALIVSAIGMFNTMTIALLERINEIGIMRAIGITKKDIKKLFLLESIIMGFLGGVGGIIVGYLAGFIANFGINILAKSFGGQALDLFYSPPWFVAVIIIFSTVIGFFTGIYPSTKAAKLNPLTALRYK